LQVKEQITKFVRLILRFKKSCETVHDAVFCLKIKQ
jgi:hypothetical protein